MIHVQPEDQAPECAQPPLDAALEVQLGYRPSLVPELRNCIHLSLEA